LGAIAVYSFGMVTSVGESGAASCAAMRAGISGFAETKFEIGGEVVLGATVSYTSELEELQRLRTMVGTTISECLDSVSTPEVSQIPLLLCVAEETRPARCEGLARSLLSDIANEWGGELHADSQLYSAGHVGGIQALAEARRLITAGAPCCLVAGVDSYLVADTLAFYDKSHRLMTDENANGFIPGEAAATVLVGPVKRQDEPQLMCLGIGFGSEPAPFDSGEPLRADGLVSAIKASFEDGRCRESDVDFRLTDNNGEAYGFKESALAVTRVFREKKEEFDLWHPADSIGEVGAAIEIGRASCRERV